MQSARALIDRWFGRPADERPVGATGWDTVAADGIPWQFAAPAGMVAIGDLQGDLGALDAILRQCGLTTPAGEWCGGRRHLVLAGDLVGGHADAMLAVHFVMRLEAQAARAGGAVHALLGNHDLLPARGEVVKWTAAEKRLYRRHPDPAAPSPRARDAFRGDSRLARWLRGRNTIVRIDDTVFVHAGLGPWFTATEPARVNATVRAWIAHWQGKAQAPPRATRWAVGVPGMARHSRFAQGPLWTRVFKAEGPRRGRGAPSRADLARWLAHAGVTRMAVGHAPVDGEIALAHPYYGRSCVLLDTRIVDPHAGSLTALSLDQRGLRAQRFAGASREPKARARELAALAAATSPSVGAVRTGWARAMAVLRGSWARLRAWLTARR